MASSAMPMSPTTAAQVRRCCSGACSRSRQRRLRTDAVAASALAIIVLALSGASGGGAAFAAVAPSKGKGSRAGGAEAKKRPPEAAAEERAASIAQETAFLAEFGQGVGKGVEGLALADAVAGLRRRPPAERRRLLDGDWQLRASDKGDLLVQLGTGLHGLPFVEMRGYFMSLRPASRKLRAVEVLSMGPIERVTTVLKGGVELADDGGLILEFTGMVDKAGIDTAQEMKGGKRQLVSQLLYAGESALVLRVKSSADRKGGFVIFERVLDLVAALRQATGETIAVLPPGR